MSLKVVHFLAIHFLAPFLLKHNLCVGHFVPTVTLVQRILAVTSVLKMMVVAGATKDGTVSRGNRVGLITSTANLKTGPMGPTLLVLSLIPRLSLITLQQT